MNLNWKQLLQQIEKLKDEDLESFANSNSWNPEESLPSPSLVRLREVVASIKDSPRFLRILELLLPAFNPLKVVQENFVVLKDILIGAKDEAQQLANIESATRICISALNLHNVDSIASLQDQLRTCAESLLNCFISETQSRWSTFGSIEMGKEQFTQNMALDPSRIPRLEYVVFAFGMAKPLLFYELLNEMALDITTRLQAFMLLKSFLILEDAPTYYLIDSELYKTVIVSALMDTDVSLFLTAITILTILLPIVATKSLPHLNQLLSILLKAMDWEISYPYIIAHLSAQSSSTTNSTTTNIDEILAMHSVYSVQRCINQYFTVLYGMLPANIMSSLGKYLKGKEEAITIQSSEFVKAEDVFEELRKRVMDTTPLISARTKKVETILAAHKCHLNTVLLDPKQERENPWFMNKESSEIMNACFNLEVQELHSSSTVALSGDAATSLDDIAAHILQINRFLYGPNFVKHLPQMVDPKGDSQTPQDRVILLKIFYLVLMNEGFFKECMRQYHIFHIHRLRKTQITSQVAQTQAKSGALQVESLQAELKTTCQQNGTLQSEIKKLESRLKILDMSHVQRFNSTTTQLREKAKILLQTQTELQARKDEIEELEKRIEEYRGMIVDFETRMGFFDAEISRNEILASENRDLKAKLAAKVNSKNSPESIAAVEDEVAVLLVANDCLRLQLSQAQEKINGLELQIPDQSSIALLQARLDAKTKAFENLLSLLAREKEQEEQRRDQSKAQIIALEKELLLKASTAS